LLVFGLAGMRETIFPFLAVFVVRKKLAAGKNSLKRPALT
jgi:hypothetical protein